MRLLFVLAAVVSAEVYFKETFDGSWQDRWVYSDWKKSAGQAGEFKLTAGDYYGDAEEDKGIMTSQDARFYDISAKFPEFSNKGKELVIQFSVKHTQKIDCGGGYVKVFPAGLDQEHMTGESEYNIMFGPDVCGTSTKKVHVIFTKNGKNHLIKKNIPAETDQLTHVYTLIVRPDNTYEVRIDGNKKESGSLSDDWDILPPKKIKDPAQSKPSDWVDNPKMADPSDVKPEGYDDIPKQIVDPEATKPSDWDTDADGEWEAPLIDNPAYKGPWKPKMIDNPAYKGPWVHPEIDNPEYEPDDTLYAYDSFGAIGIDIWQVKSGTIFDNIILTDSVTTAEKFLADTYLKNKDAEKAAFEALEKKKADAEEAERKAAEEERKKSSAAEEEEDEDTPKEKEDL
jgi:calreticulin